MRTIRITVLRSAWARCGLIEQEQAQELEHSAGLIWSLPGVSDGALGLVFAFRADGIPVAWDEGWPGEAGIWTSKDARDVIRHASLIEKRF